MVSEIAANREQLLSHASRLGVAVEVIANSDSPNGLSLNAPGIPQASWVAFDGYQFDLSYQKAAADSGRKVLVVDDYAHLQEYEADILLNQNLGAEGLPYQAVRAANRLFGPTYALLRPEFAMRRRQIGCRTDGSLRVLVAVGGGDDHGLAGALVAVLETLTDNLSVTVVAGAAYPDVGRLQRVVGKRSDWRLLHNVTDMSQIMIQSDLAISTAGSTCWELCCLGVPMILFVIAKNQEGIANALDASGAAINMGWHEQCAETELREVLCSVISKRDLRLEMAQAGQDIVDGEGASRVVQRMRTLAA